MQVCSYNSAHSKKEITQPRHNKATNNVPPATNTENGKTKIESVGVPEAMNWDMEKTTTLSNGHAADNRSLLLSSIERGHDDDDGGWEKFRGTTHARIGFTLHLALLNRFWKGQKEFPLLSFAS